MEGVEGALDMGLAPREKKPMELTQSRGLGRLPVLAPKRGNGGLELDVGEGGVEFEGELVREEAVAGLFPARSELFALGSERAKGGGLPVGGGMHGARGDPTPFWSRTLFKRRNSLRGLTLVGSSIFGEARLLDEVVVQPVVTSSDSSPNGSSSELSSFVVGITSFMISSEAGGGCGGGGVGVSVILLWDS